MRNIALKLMYNGTAYHGWQVQKNAVSVCGTLEKALTEIIIFLAGYVPAEHLVELQKKVAASREKNLERFKQEIEQLPLRDAKRLMKELAILEKIREQA